MTKNDPNFKSPPPSGKIIYELCEPVVYLAQLNPGSGWPDSLCQLILYARRVKAEYGFHVEVHGTKD